MLTFYTSLLDTQEEQDKLTYIYENYYKMMYYIASKNVRNPSDTEDALHNSILKMMNYLHNINLEDDLSSRAYVRCIVESVSRDLNRKNARIVDEYDITNVDLESEDVADSAIAKIEYEHLLQCIRELPDTYRRACEMKLVLNLKEREIADILGLTVNCVGVRINRARKILQKRLIEEGGANGYGK